MRFTFGQFILDSQERYPLDVDGLLSLAAKAASTERRQDLKQGKADGRGLPGWICRVVLVLPVRWWIRCEPQIRKNGSELR